MNRRGSDNPKEMMATAMKLSDRRTTAKMANPYDAALKEHARCTLEEIRDGEQVTVFTPSRDKYEAALQSLGATEDEIVSITWAKPGR